MVSLRNFISREFWEPSGSFVSLRGIFKSNTTSDEKLDTLRKYISKLDSKSPEKMEIAYGLFELSKSIKDPELKIQLACIARVILCEFTYGSIK